MDAFDLASFFSSAWQSTIKGCLEKIHDREDKRTVRSFRSYDDVLEHAINDPDEPLSPSVSRELSMISPRLVELREFSQMFAENLGTRLDPSMFWGLLGVMLVVSAQRDEVDTTRRLVQMLRRLSRDIEILRGHVGSRTNLSNKEKESVFEICVALTKFFGDTIELFRDDEHFSRAQSSGQDPWRRLQDTFDATIRDVEESLKTVEKTAALSTKTDNMALLYSLMSMTPRSYKDEASLPCFMLPAARSSRFFDRDDVIERMEEHFNQPAAHPFRSIALHGMGGVGKTHVAMKYAEKKFAKHELSAVLWVEGESELKIKQSFTEIANRLQLPSYVPHSHDDNRLAVMNWLQHTRAKWLIVYDNVETFDALHTHWPNSAARGHALITTRNNSLAYEPAETGIEVPSWDPRTGSMFLLHLLSGHISADILVNEEQSALELSERLSGHALALARMGGIIHRRAWTIEQLIEVYDRQPDFNDGIGPVWHLSFQNLHPHSSLLLSIFSFCSADNISQTILEPENPEALPEDLKWITDIEELSQALEELQSLSLIKKDRETRTISVHRLIQSHFKQFLGDAGRQDAHMRTSKVLYLAFPRRTALLHDLWDQVNVLLQHAISLKNLFRNERKRTPQFKASWDLCDLLLTCQRFLLDQSEFVELEDMCSVNKDAMSTLDEKDRTWDMLSTIPSHLGQMYTARGGYQKKGLKLVLESLDIRLRDKDGDKSEVAWSQHNIGLAYAAMNDWDNAHLWYSQARDTWRSWGESLPEPVTDAYSPYMRMTMSGCLLYMGRLDEAKSLIQSPLKDFTAGDSKSKVPAAMATFCLGRIEMAEKNFAIAEARFMEAQNLWLMSDKARTGYFNGACMYQMGCCSLDQGNVEAAVKHLTDSMVVTFIHKSYMVGEHARCLFKISQVFYEDGREREANQMLQEAESLYFSCSENQGKSPTEEDYDSLIDVRWR